MINSRKSALVHVLKLAGVNHSHLSPSFDVSALPDLLEASARGAPLSSTWQGLRAEDERRLMAATSKRVVRELYEHVRDEARRRGNGEHLPQIKENFAKYKHMHYVSR